MSAPAFIRRRNQLLTVFLYAALLVVLGLKLAIPINLCAVDIGRHLTNGQLILNGVSDVLYRNYYSFTFPNYPFINHHWLFGVIVLFLSKVGGFTLLSLSYVLTVLGGVWCVLRATARRGQETQALLIASLCLPLLWDRHEIRPEGFSLLLMGQYYYVLTRASLGDMDRKMLYALLLPAQLIWVNTHIFFFMGPVLVAVFLWEGFLRRCSVCVKTFTPLLIVTVLINVFNPSGLSGMLTPLNILKGFGYRLAENQNVFFMMSFFPKNHYFPYCLGVAAAAILLITAVIFKRRVKENLPFILLLLFIMTAAIKGNRLMPYFALFFIPLGSYFTAQLLEGLKASAIAASRVLMLLVTAVILGVMVFTINPKEVGAGLYPGVNSSAEFFKSNRLKGPIFSNYDIGGYLIYHLHDSQKVFVDNRQEAFPPEFFKDVYIKMQQDEKTWQALDEKYGFNAIYFYRHDLTDWGQNFLITRVSDPRWAPVFVDGFTIIFLKRNDANRALIAAHELPRSMFSVKRQ